MQSVCPISQTISDIINFIGKLKDIHTGIIATSLCDITAVILSYEDFDFVDFNNVDDHLHDSTQNNKNSFSQHIGKVCRYLGFCAS